MKITIFRCFFRSLPSFDLEPSSSMYFVYLSRMQCFSPSLGKYSPLCSSFSSSSFSVRLSCICYRSYILVPCCAVVSYDVLSYFSQYWSFFLRFWLSLETTSRWVGLDFSCHWCCFPRCWFAVTICWSDFGDLTSMFFFLVLAIWLLCSFSYLEDASTICWFHFVYFYLFVLSSRYTFNRWSRLLWLFFRHIYYSRFG